MKIVVKVNGGLGNQMFQYAMGRALALRTGASLLLDLRFFGLDGEHTKRPFELDLLNTHIEPATPDDLALFDPPPAPDRGQRMLRRLFPAKGQPLHVQEQGFPFQSAVVNIRRDAYLEGHWQSEKYFLDQETAIREDFTFDQPLSCASKEVLRQIRQAAHAASLHVRRGDYVHQAAASAHHGVCAPGYYQAAMERLQHSAGPLHYFVFSDDIAWARHNLRFNAPATFVDHNIGADSWQDMQLMSACKHHIIANSSFSWWGAWLSSSPGKSVVAPMHWFQAPGLDTRDLIPEAWVRL